MKLLLDEDLPSKLRYRLRPEHEAISGSYPLPVLVFNAVGDQYDDYNALIPQVKALLAQPGLAGGVHVISVNL